MFDFSQLNSVMGGFNGAPNDPTGLLQLQQMNAPQGQGMASPYANTQGFQGLLQPYSPYGQTQSPYTQMNPFTGQMIQDYLTPFQEQRQAAQDNPNQTISPAMAPPVAPQPAQQPTGQYYLGTDMFGAPNWGTAQDVLRYNQFTEGGG